MKKYLIITAVAIISLVVFIKSNIAGALAMFILFGIMPGTPYVVPPSTMFLIMSAAIWLILFRFTAIEVLIHRANLKKYKQHLSTPRSTLPRRRFSQI